MLWYFNLFAKKLPSLPLTEGVSFCMITNSKKVEITKLAIQSILSIPYFPVEVILTGVDLSLFEDVKGVQLIEDRNVESNRTSYFRNLAASHSHYPWLMFIDDDIFLPHSWGKNLNEQLANQGIGAFRLNNLDNTRHYDWSELKNNKTRLLNYNQKSLGLYLAGGLILARKDFWTKHPWPQTKGYYEGEDVHFSQTLIHERYPLKLISDEPISLHLDPRYTQVGRSVVKRTYPGIQDWITQRYSLMSESELYALLSEYENHPTEDYFGERADILKTLHQKSPHHPITLEKWDLLVKNRGGFVNGSALQTRSLSLISHHFSPQWIEYFKE
jgi:hypothetical protein